VTIWEEQTRRIQLHAIQSPTDPSDWMAEYSARTARLLVLPLHPDRNTILPVVLQTDVAFIEGRRPSDLAVLDAIEFDDAYNKALEYALEQMPEIKLKNQK